MSGATGLVRAVPEAPIDLDEVLRRWPALRQSNLSQFDDCELATLFALRYENGWSTSPQARGTIEHRVFAECLREMQRSDSESIPVDVALAILLEKMRQHGIAPEDRVRVPLREIPDMEMAVKKWAWDNTFTIRNLIDVEKRLSTTLEYRAEGTGELITRTISGQLDVLLSRGEDEAVVLDWKGTWGLPPEREEDNNQDGGGLSYHGFFQQRVYGVLVMRNYSTINAVTLREFYHRRSKARPARITRADLPAAEEKLALVVEAFDAALAAGEPPKLTIEALEQHGHWKPSPGHHCHYCSRSRFCPIDDEYTVGGITTQADAERLAGARQVAKGIIKNVTPHLMAWADLHGAIPLKRSKGRRVLGYRKIKGGLRFEEHTPQGVDRPATEEAFDPNALTDAMKASAEEARAERQRVA